MKLRFFQDELAFKEFTSGNFEFGAGAEAVVVTGAAQAQTNRGKLFRAWRHSPSPRVDYWRG
jgi:hypothetical protein